MMMERFLRLFRLSRDLHDLEALSDADFVDLGVSRSEALQLASLPDEVPVRVTEMAKVFGLDATALLADRRVWNEILHSCNNCDDLGTCRRFLARDAGDEAANPADVDFCPNRETFTALAALR